MAAKVPAARPEPVFEMRETDTKGVACFATRDIQAGEEVLWDICTITCSLEEDTAAAMLELVIHFEALDDEAQARYRQLYSWEPETHSAHFREALSMIERDGQLLAPDVINDYVHLFEIFRSNNFEIIRERRNEDGSRTQSRSGIFFEASRFNHSCDNNVDYYATITPGYWVGKAKQRIRAGDELTLTYIPRHIPTRERQNMLRDCWGFTCTCSKCQGVDAEYDIRLREAVAAQQGELADGTVPIPVYQEELDEPAAERLLRRIERLEILHWDQDLFFAYWDAADYYFTNSNLTREYDAQGAAQLLLEALNRQDQVVDLGNRLWPDDDYIMADAKYLLRSMEMVHERDQREGNLALGLT
ncbi:SET domain-containing protein [Hypoxylon crocopeplum]|nr:SET domain-containing protein [Hypoxylon crocopeplum]